MEPDVFSLEQVAIRMVKEPPLYADYPLDHPEAVVRLFADILKEYDREVVAIVNLRSDMTPISANLVSIGSLNYATVQPREILKSAILSNAAAMMMVHNHPSARLLPSKEDIEMTQTLASLCGMLGVRFVEHVIVGPGENYYSFHEKGIVPLPKVPVTGEIENVSLGGFKVAEKSTEYVSGREYYEQKKAELKEITDQLEKGVAEIFASDRYREMLNMFAKFPEYSANNCLLILLQKPDAQLCQSYTGWKNMDRYVKKGERGIKIFAPTPYTVQKEVPKLDIRGNPVFDKDGELVMETKEYKVTGFKVASTFDVSQTEGKELPTIGVDELTGDVENYHTMYEDLVDICPVPITFEQIPGGAKGYYDLIGERIAIQEGMSEVQTVKTIIHEMAHQKLHSLKKGADKQSRNSKEVEAESVAYTVCRHYGIDTSDYSFSYVVGWSAGKDTPELKESMETIRKTAAQMIRDIDEKGKERATVKEVQTAVWQEPVADNEVVHAKPEEKTLDRKQEVAKLLKNTAARCLGEAPKEKKPSVRQKLLEETEKMAKTPAKKTRKKEVEPCV